MENENYKATDVHPTVLRLHPDLRAELMRIAAVNGRSLSKEIAHRLKDSLKPQATAIAPTPPRYSLDHPSSGGLLKQQSPAYALTDIDRAMLSVFHRLPPEKQLALLSLFK